MAEVNLVDGKLPKETVFVQFVKKAKGNISNKNHIMYGGMDERAIRQYPAKQLRNGKYANVLTDEEKVLLEKLMKLPEGGLSIYNKKDNYWDNVQIRLGKEGKYFNLEEPDEYIAVKILESYTDEIAGSLKELENNPKVTYKFVIIRGDEESVMYNQAVDIKKDAFKALGKLEDSREAMEDFLMMFGMPVAKNSNLTWITKEVNKIADQKSKEFLKILNDPDYKMKLLIKKGVKSGFIVHNGGLYVTSSGVNISFKNTEPTLGNAIEYLKSDEGQDLRIRIQGEIEE